MTPEKYYCPVCNKVLHPSQVLDKGFQPYDDGVYEHPPRHKMWVMHGFAGTVYEAWHEVRPL